MSTSPCPVVHVPDLWHPDGTCAWVEPDREDQRCPERATRLHGSLHLCGRHHRVATGLDTYMEIHRELFSAVRRWHVGQMSADALHAAVIADEAASRIARPHIVAQQAARTTALRILRDRGLRDCRPIDGLPSRPGQVLADAEAAHLATHAGTVPGGTNGTHPSS